MQDRPTLRRDPALVTSRIAVVAFSSKGLLNGVVSQKVPGPSGDGCPPFQSSRQGLPERHPRDCLAMSVADHERVPRYVLVLPDPARHEVSCALDGCGHSRVAVGKVDPLQVRDDLLAVESVKIEARHGRERCSPRKGCGPPGKRRVAGLNRVYFEKRSFSSSGSRVSLTQRRSAMTKGSRFRRASKSATRRVRSSALAWQW